MTHALSLILLSIASSAYGGQLWADVCSQPDVASLPFCDKALSHKDRAADYIARVPLSNKAAMMQNGAASYDTLHIPPYQWGSEGLHGPLQPCVCDGSACKCPTSFPCPSALASAFNDTLYFLVGQADGREARAINNLRNHVTQNKYGDGIDYWSPTINLQRDPRWGRNQEVPGEDPTLTGQYAANFVRGLQGEVGGEDEKHVQIAACCKHFVANSLENWNGYTRHNFNANISREDLATYYLPPFRACVMEGKSLGIMCSYNAVNGFPSCANPWLLNDTLRNSWRFDGYVTSDCGAIRDVCGAKYHNFTSDCANGTALSIKAGTDVDCGGVYKPNIPKAVASNLLREEDVDRSFARLTNIQMKLGLFDNDKKTQPYFNLGINDIDTSTHQQLALEAARQSIVLLKNDACWGGVCHMNPPLPLDPGSSIAVVGPHFNATQVFLSNYHGSRCVNGKPGDGKDFSCIQTPLAAISAANVGGHTQGALGCEVSSGRDEIEAAVSLAKNVDVVVLVMGIDDGQEREGQDRYNTTLPGLQTQLVDAILALRKKTVLVLLNGGTMSLGPIKEAAPAIVETFYGGEMGAQAMADVLFGAYNPSGKLAATMYPPEFVEQTPLTEFSLTAPPGRTHMFYTGKPEFEFGHGLSFTSWDLAWHEPLVTGMRWSTLASDTEASFSVRVANTGKRVGKQTVLMFWRPVGHHSALKQKLVAYGGLNDISPGGQGILRFTVRPDHFGIANRAGHMELHEGDYEVIVRDGVNELTHLIKMTGNSRIVDQVPDTHSAVIVV